MNEILEAAVLGESDIEDEDIEDVLLIHIFNDNLGNRAELYGRFSFNEQNEIEVKSNFRFEKVDIPRLVAALGIPDMVTTDDHITLPGRYTWLKFTNFTF